MSEEHQYARLRDVPAATLARNIVSGLILAKGNIALWDALLLKLVVEMREEYLEEVNKTKLYNFLRDEDAWGEDTVILPTNGQTLEYSAWSHLGELSGSNFDAFVERKMKAPEEALPVAPL